MLSHVHCLLHCWTRPGCLLPAAPPTHPPCPACPHSLEQRAESAADALVADAGHEAAAAEEHRLDAHQARAVRIHQTKPHLRLAGQGRAGGRMQQRIGRA